MPSTNGARRAGIDALLCSVFSIYQSFNSWTCREVI